MERKMEQKMERKEPAQCVPSERTKLRAKILQYKFLFLFTHFSFFVYWL